MLLLHLLILSFIFKLKKNQRFTVAILWYSGWNNFAFSFLFQTNVNFETFKKEKKNRKYIVGRWNNIYF